MSSFHVGDGMNKKGKVGFTAGSFDLLHAGHVLMLEDCKRVCDWLIVAVQSDPTIDRSSKNKPIQEYEERILVVKSSRYIDEIVLYDTEADLHRLLTDIKPNIRIIGSDWKGKEYTGHELPIEMYFHERNHDWSTSDLRRRVHSAEHKKIMSASNKHALTNRQL